MVIRLNWLASCCCLSEQLTQFVESAV